MILKSNEKVKNTKAIGVWYGVLAFIAWGLLPLYWKLLKEIPSDQIFAHRIFWSFIYVTGMIKYMGRVEELKAVMKDKKKKILVICSAMFISINWFLYIWAVNANKVIEASLGYYINPLVVILLGMIILKEKLNFWQYVALILATIGVVFMTVTYGKMPWIAVCLAVSFSIYGLLKKFLNVEATVGMALETMVLTPLALGYIVFQQFQGVGAIGNVSIFTTIILMASGVATATPLMWYAKSAQKIELSTLGFIQYLGPTITLFLGVVVFKEPFTKTDFISFGFIWSSLIVYSLSNFKFMKNLQSKFFTKE